MPASQVFSGNGDPNGVVDGNPGDFYQDQTGKLWVNTAAPSTWKQLSTGGAGQTTDPIFGTGPQGDVVFDGVATILGIAPVAGVYMLTKDIMVRNMTVNVGVTVFAANFAIFVSGTLSGAGTIHNDGNPAITFNGGLPTPGTPRYFATEPGGGSGNPGSPSPTAPYPYYATVAGGTAGVAPNGAGGAGAPGSGAGGGGGGASVQNGAAGGAVNATIQEAADYTELLRGKNIAGSPYTFGSGGGSGSTQVGQEGGGGASGGMLFIAAQIIAGTLAIHARGGAGAAGGVPGAPGGGGGGGGMVVVITESIAGTVVVDANGGLGGAGNAGAGHGGAGGSGPVELFVL